MKKKLALLVSLSLILCLCAACSSTPSASSSGDSSQPENTALDDQYVIGFTVNDLNDTWVSFVIDYVKQWDAEQEAVTVLIGDGASDVSTQMAIVEGWIEMGVNAICLKPVDYEASVAMCDAVRAAGITYVALQQDVDAADCFVGANGVDTGRAQMEAVIDAIGGSGKIAYLSGTQGTLVASEREDGSMEILSASEKCELAAREDGNWLREDAMAIVETWVTSGVQFDAICAACDEMAIGANLALEAAGITDVVVAGIDGTEAALEQMEAGKLALTFFADAKGLAYESLNMALESCKGNPVEDVTLYDVLVTPENEAEYMAVWKS